MSHFVFHKLCAHLNSHNNLCRISCSISYVLIKVIGSPTYYGTMAAEIKKLLDDSVKFHGKLDGRAGAAFASSANISGGNETTILDILNTMLIHGMIMQGDWQGDHYGPVAIGAPDDRSIKECLRMGARFAKLVKKCRI